MLLVKEKKYKIMQQIAFNGGYGGVSKSFKRLMNNPEMQKFNMVILEQHEIVRGISIRVIKRYIKEILKEKPDLIHIRGVLPDGLMALIAAKIAKVPCICMSVHGMYSDEVKIGKIKKIISGVLVEPISFLLADSIYLVYEGALSRNKFRRFSKKIWGFIYNPLPNWNYELEQKDAYIKVREEYKINDTDILTLCVSRVTYEKGFSFVLEALQNLRKDWPSNLKIMIIGNGEYVNIIKEEMEYEILEKKIIMIPGTTEIKKYYYAADVFFTGSLHENHSNAILEACAAKIPIIATNVGGNCETIENTRGGWIISPYSSKELFEKIKNVSFYEKKLLKEMGNNAYNFAKQKFSQEKIYQKLASYYISSIEKKK